jgi:hypothetical protein
MKVDEVTSDWKLYYTEEGCAYYFNHVTQESIWAESEENVSADSDHPYGNQSKYRDIIATRNAVFDIDRKKYLNSDRQTRQKLVDRMIEFEYFLESSVGKEALEVR